jgi:hypothetical protein
MHIVQYSYIVRYEALLGFIFCINSNISNSVMYH